MIGSNNLVHFKSLRFGEENDVLDVLKDLPSDDESSLAKGRKYILLLNHFSITSSW